MKKTTWIAAMFVLIALAPPSQAIAFDNPVPICGDVDDSDAVSASDALLVLKKAVGQPLALTCKTCPFGHVYGNETEFPDSSQFSPNVLLGSRVFVDTGITLTHLGITGKAPGPHVQLTLYSDFGGNPDELQAHTAVKTLLIGEVWFAIDPIVLPSGYYWIMAVFDSQAAIGFSISEPGAIVKYRTLNFSDDLPPTFGPPTTFVGQKFNLYLHGLE